MGQKNTANTDVGFLRIKGHEPRTQIIATLFTRSEEQALQKRAEANGQTLREWARDALLRVVLNDSHAEMEMHIFTEIVGIQMLLMSALDPLLRGEKMAPEARRPSPNPDNEGCMSPRALGQARS